MLSIVKTLGLPLRQSYTFVLKRIYRDQRFRNHPKNQGKALKADRRLRTIAGSLVRELKRNLAGNHDYDSLLSLFEQVLFHRNAVPGGKSLPCMSRRYSASARARNIRSTSSATRSQSSAQLPE